MCWKKNLKKSNQKLVFAVQHSIPLGHLALVKIDNTATFVVPAQIAIYNLVPLLNTLVTKLFLNEREFHELQNEL